MGDRLALFLAAAWWGGTGALAFLAVPTLFLHFGNPAIAGPAAARLFTVLSWMAVGCGLALLLCGRNQRQSPVGQALPVILLGMLCALVMEHGVSHQIQTARAAGSNLRLWHGLGSALVLAQWLCASRVLWLLAGRGPRD